MTSHAIPTFQTNRRLVALLIAFPALLLLTGIVLIERDRVYLLNDHFRWLLELVALCFVFLEGFGVWYLLKKRLSESQNLQRLNRVYALRIDMDDVFDQEETEAGLMQGVCDLLVRSAGFSVCVIARPEQGQGSPTHFVPQILAGNAADLPCALPSDIAREVWQTDISIFSTCTRPNRHTYQSTNSESGLRRASAVLPIRRSGQVYAVLGVYHAQEKSCDVIMRQFLQESVHDLSRRLLAIDIKQRNAELNTELMRMQSYHQGLFEQNAASMLIVDATRHIRDVNPAFCSLTGHPRSALIGESTAIFLPDARSFKRLGEYCQQAFTSSEPIQPREIVIVDRVGKNHPVQLMGNRVTLQDQTMGVIWSWLDLTAVNEAKAALDHQATHDMLTGLPNRLALQRHLEGAIKRSHQSLRGLAVGFADLDGFKAVNDQWGHAAGDELLRILADRWHRVTRSGDLVARLGGDEFVFVFENLSVENPANHLSHILTRIEQCVNMPVLLESGHEVRVGISMGIALYPEHGEDEDTLLRVADMAMYQSKHQKIDRRHWWQIGIDLDQDEGTPTGELDPFGVEAKDLLIEYRPTIEAVITLFVDEFYTTLSQEIESKSILATLDATELEHLKHKQAEHLRFLLEPETTEVAIIARGTKIGQVHALIGLNNTLLLRSLSLYESLLERQLEPVISTLRERFTIGAIISRRIMLDIHAEMDAQNATQYAYATYSTPPLPTGEVRYTDLLNQELNLLAQLPGMVAVALFRPNAQGQLVATQVAGKQGEGLADLLLQPEFEISIDANLPQGQRKSAIAWRERRILSAPAYARDSIYPHWREAINRFGIRSHLAIPIFDFTRNPQAVLCLYGGFPNQFESPYMKQFADALQYRFGEIQARSASQHVPTITLEEGREWLQALFTGGLRMYVQPILDLTQGRVTKVEALARLQLPDGRILSPGQFLPLLGDSELNRMFVMGLDIALGHRTAWAASGIEVQVSVNLPTQALQEPDCIRWVAKALAKHKTPAAALTLELLETGVISEGGMGQTLMSLRQMGVQLAMDDLGSGYSSLLRLAELPFDYLKIDQGIIKRVHQAPLDIFSVISAIAQMGENFERSIVAEGLEDYGMLEAAAILGAEFGQGYCIAKPMPAEALRDWLEDFVFPIDPQGNIRTALGALAYFWLSTRNGRHHRQIHVTSCRLHSYLLAQNLPDDSDPMRWHRLTHDEDSVEAIAAMLHLKNWLSEQAQTERAVHCPVS